MCLILELELRSGYDWLTVIPSVSVRVWARRRLSSTSFFMAMIRVNGMVTVTFRDWVRSKIRLCSRLVRVRMGLVLGLGLWLGFGYCSFCIRDWVMV